MTTLATAGLALASVPAADAATLRVSGECQGCEPATAPAAGLRFTAIHQRVRVSEIPRSSAIVAFQTGPGGTIPLQSCRSYGNVDPNSTADLFSRYRGNGDYTVVVRTYKGRDNVFPMPCEGAPSQEDAITYTIAAAATVGTPATPPLIRRTGKGKRGGGATVPSRPASMPSKRSAAVNLARDQFHPEWNYSISPSP